jgi:hypothetical protein
MMLADADSFYAMLGLATTRELLHELEVRGRLGGEVGRSAELHEANADLRVTVQGLLERLPRPVLDHRVLAS